MKIGILGAGNIGTTLANRLAASGHQVKVANSRGPETIGTRAVSTGATAVTAQDAVQDVDVLITSVPFGRIKDVAPLVRQTPERAVIIDTSNYYPHRDGNIAALDEGEVESVWVSAQYGRAVMKAWNAISTESFASRATHVGNPDRLAIPVAGDDAGERLIAMSLVEQTGFDAVDAGKLETSWRQSPGTPVYCTDLDKHQLGVGLAAADAADRIVRRNLMVQVLSVIRYDPTPLRTTEFIVQLHRVFNT